MASPKRSRAGLGDIVETANTLATSGTIHVANRGLSHGLLHEQIDIAPQNWVPQKEFLSKCSLLGAGSTGLPGNQNKMAGYLQQRR